MIIIDEIKSVFKGTDGENSFKRVFGAICMIALLIAFFMSKDPKIRFDPVLVDALKGTLYVTIGGTVAEIFTNFIGPNKP